MTTVLEQSVKFLAIVQYSYGGAWHIAETPEEALKAAGRHVAMTLAKVRKAPHYVLEFPAAAVINVNDTYGGWSADLAPLRVERSHGMPEGENLLGINFGDEAVNRLHTPRAVKPSDGPTETHAYVESTKPWRRAAISKPCDVCYGDKADRIHHVG